MGNKSAKSIIALFGTTLIGHANASLVDKNNYFNADLQLGYAMLAPLSSIKIPGTSLRHNGGIYGGIAGGYNRLFTNRFSLGLELGIHYGYKVSSGNLAGITSTLDIVNVPLLITSKYAFDKAQNTKVFVKAGGVYSRQNCSSCLGCSGSCFRKRITVSKIKPMVTVGLSKQFTEKLSVFTQYGYVFSNRWNHHYNSGRHHGSTILTYNALTVGLSLQV